MRGRGGEVWNEKRQGWRGKVGFFFVKTKYVGEKNKKNLLLWQNEVEFSRKRVTSPAPPEPKKFKKREIIKDGVGN